MDSDEFSTWSAGKETTEEDGSLTSAENIMV